MAFNKRNTKSLITRNQAEPPFPHTQTLHVFSGKVCLLQCFCTSVILILIRHYLCAYKRDLDAIRMGAIQILTHGVVKSLVELQLSSVLKNLVKSQLCCSFCPPCNDSENPKTLKEEEFLFCAGERISHERSTSLRIQIMHIN